MPRKDRVFTPIEQAIARVQGGEMIVVVDDADRENEGDLIVAAEHATARAINFMVKFGRGLVCMPCDPVRLDQLDIHPMLPDHQSTGDTPFAISIDHVTAGTGIAAQARAETVRQVLNTASLPQDFRRPGHIFPLRAKPGGVLERRGHTEAALDLVRLGGLYPAAVLCEILHDDGSAARLPYLTMFAEEHNMALISIEQLVQYRLSIDTNEMPIPVRL